MRDYTGVSAASIKDPRTRDIVAEIDYFLRDLSRGMGRIQNGQVPDGSGNPIASDPFTGTPGSVIFIGADAELEEDNSNFFWDDGNNRLGLGTNSPGAVLELSQASVSVFNRPTGTTSPGLWVGQPGLSTNLHLFIDEVVEDPADYASQNGNLGTGCNVNLGPPAGLQTDTAILRFGVRRAGAAAGSIFNFQLQRSGNPIYTFSSAAGIGTSFGVLTHTLTAGEMTDIFVTFPSGDLGFIASGSGIGDSFDIDWVEIEWQGGPSAVNLAEWNTSGAQTGRITSEGYLESRRLNLLGATSGTLTHIPANTTTDHSLTWPAAQGGALTLLENDGSGNLSWASIASLGLTNALLDGANHTDTVAQGVTRGSLIVGNATPKWDELVIGASGRLLTSNGTDAAWVDPTFLDNAFRVQDNGDATKQLALEVSGITTGTTRTVTAQNQDGTMALLEATQTFSGTCSFTDPGTNMLDSLILVDSISGNTTALFTAGGMAASHTISLPEADGTVVLTTGTQNLAQKSLQTSCDMIASTASTGVSFRDTTTSTKRLRFITSTAVGNNAIRFTNTAAREMNFGNIAGNVVIVGDDPPAVASGSLGKVDLTAQTANIGTTNLSSTPPAGLYEVEIYLATTTGAAAAGTLAVTIGWTDVVGATTTTPIAAHSLVATGRSTGTQLVQVASGDITYAVAVTGIYSTSAFAVYIRVKHLG